MTPFFTGYLAQGVGPAMPFVENTASGYARVPVIFTPLNLGQASLALAVTFPGSAAYTVTQRALYDAPTGGNLIIYWNLKNAVSVTGAGQDKLNAGALNHLYPALYTVSGAGIGPSPVEFAAGSQIGQTDTGKPIFAGVALEAENGTIYAAPVNVVTSVDGRAGPVTLSSTDISGLGTAATQSASSFQAAGTPPGIGFIPNSAIPAPYSGQTPWLSDTINGLDLYKLGLGLTPTIYYDPSAAGTSRNLGTFNNPYTTVAQVQARVTGNMAGQVLGVKRGTQSAALALTCYGSASAPFAIVPYGSAQALPIFSGETVRSTWASYQTSPYQIWQLSGIPASNDIYENYNRLFGVSGSSLANLVTAINNYAASPKTGTVGCAGYYAGTCYIYLIDGTSPNLGQVKSADAAHALAINYSDVANTGNIIVAGMAAIMSYDNVLQFQCANLNSTNAPSNLQIIASMAGHSGTQYQSTFGCDGFFMAGSGNSLAAGTLLTGAYMGGNYAFNTLNNAYELDTCSSGTVEHNVGYLAGGNSILEMYDLTTNIIVQFNRGYGDLLTPSRLYSGYHQGGVWLNNFNGLNAADNTKNGSRTVRFNYIQDATHYAIDQSGGTNDTIYNNTIVLAGTTTASAVIFQGGSGSTGHQFFNNAMFNNSPSQTGIGFVTINSGTPIPSIDYNSYYNETNHTYGNSGWGLNGTTYYQFSQGAAAGTWQNAITGDTHSNSYINNGTSSGFTAAATFLGANTDYTITGTSSPVHLGGKTIVALGPTNDIDGRAIISPTTPNTGSWQG